MASLESAGKGASPSYMRKVMSELHSSERVPLWKEEMVERVKRAATARQAHEDLVKLQQSGGVKAASGSRSARAHGRHRALADDDAASAVSGLGGTRGGHGASGKALSIADSLAESGVQLNSAAAKEIERKLFVYQDAISEQELQQQLLDQKMRAMKEEEAALVAKQQSNPLLKGCGTANIEKELQRNQLRQKSKLSKQLQVTEERVADAERLNKSTVETINKLRKGRADFLRQTAKLEERVAAMAQDMKHFSQNAHASLDEKEKLEGRLKRQQHDYRNEIAHAEHVFEMTAGELQALDERIAQGHAEEEQFLQVQKQDEFRHVRQLREDEQKRELRLGYLQNHVRGQEMDFQRLHRIMGVKFTPEKPDSVQEIVSASLKHEQRNSSLLHYVGVQTQEIEETEEQLAALERHETVLLAQQKEAAQAGLVAQAQAEQESGSAEAIVHGIVKRDDDLSKLCPLVVKLCEMVGGSPEMVGDGGMLALKGCRPDTLADFLRLIDVQLKELYARANILPTASSNEWLRDFLRPKEVGSRGGVALPNVIEIRRELEAAAQKQKEAKEAKAMLQGTADEGAAGLSVTVG